jgi:hypothetical protein
MDNRKYGNAWHILNLNVKFRSSPFARYSLNGAVLRRSPTGPLPCFYSSARGSIGIACTCNNLMATHISAASDTKRHTSLIHCMCARKNSGFHRSFRAAF